jgi:hypothetical protein
LFGESTSIAVPLNSTPKLEATPSNKEKPTLENWNTPSRTKTTKKSHLNEV